MPYHRGSFVAVFLSAVLLLTPIQSMSTAPMKRVLVTGGNKGIGFAICRKLLEEHPDIYVLLGSRDKGRGEMAIAKLIDALPGCGDRLELVEIDTSSDESVNSASEKVREKLFGIVNNAGIGFGYTFDETLNTNYFGPRRVNDAFSKHLVRPSGRVVNISSASGPMFVNSLGIPSLKSKLTQPLTINGGMSEVDEIANSYFGKMDYGNDSYGLSKALLNAYTAIHAKSEPKLFINSCSPGYIDTDLTKGMGATNPPSEGAICPVYLLTSADVEKVPTGWYYGSDCIRSPLHVYRGPGDPPYQGP